MYFVLPPSLEICVLLFGCAIAFPFRGCLETDGCLRGDLGLSFQATIRHKLSEGLHSAMACPHQRLLTYYRELGIYLWDVFQITRLSIVG